MIDSIPEDFEVMVAASTTDLDHNASRRVIDARWSTWAVIDFENDVAP